MDSETVIKGALVFALTFGMFVVAKQGASAKPSDPQTTHVAAPVESPSPSDAQSTEQPNAMANAPVAESTEQATSTAIDTQATRAPSPDTVAGVKVTLDEWVNAINSNNLQLESSCYAPMLTSYFSQSNVDNDGVKASKQSFIDQGNRVISFGLEQITMDDITPSSATVHLVKNVTWQNANGVQIQKKITSTLTLQSFSEGWKITSEQNQR